MGKIIILDEKTSNQIAAGEVIERPASVIKEMAENAIDAGATAITVEIRNGGISYIRITDNGSGMEADDVEIAFERHATSKLKQIEDLDALTTMGFRGEALAAIASVSRLEVKTKTSGSSTGIHVKIEGGRVVEVASAGCPVGTTFIVRNLFFNTPARYKFLKKDATEAGYVSDNMEKLALAYPGISFKLISNNETIMHTPGNHDLLSVIYSIYGKETAKGVIETSYAQEALTVSGFIGRPETARGTRSQQSFFLNRRFIRSKIMTSAIEEAYKTVLMQHKFPFCVLNITAPPASFDVNVHPQKLEVRFSNEGALYTATYHGVKSALQSVSLIGDFEENPARGNHKSIQGHQPAQTILASELFVKPPERTVSYKQEERANNVAIPYMVHEAKPSECVGESACTMEITEPQRMLNMDTALQVDAIAINQAKPDAEQAKAAYHVLIDDGQDKREDQPSVPIVESFPAIAIEEHPHENKDKETLNYQYETLNYQPKEAVNLRSEASKEVQVLLHAEIVGQAFDTYILLEYGNSLYIIDQHAAHERIRYEMLKKRLTSRDMASQAVLEPYILKLSPQEQEFVFAKLTDFEAAGFDIEAFGPGTIIIRGIPDLYDGIFKSADFMEILERWMQSPISVSGIPDEALFTMACKGAIKANQRLGEQEIRALIQNLCDTENPYTCVHGRPITVTMDQKELEKRFKRIV